MPNKYLTKVPSGYAVFATFKMVSISIIIDILLDINDCASGQMKRLILLTNHYTWLIEDWNADEIWLNNTLRNEDELFIIYLPIDIVTEPIFIG